MHDLDRTITDSAESGFVTIHAREGSHHLLGATNVARHAGEMINEITLRIVTDVAMRALGACYRMRARMHLFMPGRARHDLPGVR